MSASEDKLRRICEDIIAPLIQADAGELFVVSIDSDSVALHLAGKCAGCPGAALTSATIIEPALRAVAPLLRVVVTSGFQVPPGASAVARSATA